MVIEIRVKYPGGPTLKKGTDIYIFWVVSFWPLASGWVEAMRQQRVASDAFCQRPWPLRCRHARTANGRLCRLKMADARRRLLPVF